MEYKDPWTLLLLLVWIPMIWVYVVREQKHRPALRFSDLSLLRRPGLSPRVKMRHLVFLLRLAGIGLLIVALARPRKGQQHEEISTEGVDIMLVFDVSTSMKALDFKPKNRLHVAKETLKEFVARRKHDRIGLVVFAARSYTKCPLTLDYNLLTAFIDDIDFGIVEDGTAIGTAIATAAARLLATTAKSNVMILSTDGANNRGDIAPVAAAQAAVELGIRIHTIGVAREGTVPYPFEVRNPFTGTTQTRIEMIESDLDEQLLVDIAAISGGRYFRAQNTEELKEIYALIDELEKTELSSVSYTTWEERFFPWLIAGALLLLLEVLLSHTVLRRIP